MLQADRDILQRFARRNGGAWREASRPNLQSAHGDDAENHAFANDSARHLGMLRLPTFIAETIAMLDQSESERLVHTIAKTRIANDVDGLMQIFAEDASFRIVGFSAEVKGREAIRATLHDLTARFGFLEWEPITVVVGDNEIAVRSRLKFKHHPNGQIAETETAEFFTVHDGRCVAFTQFADTALVADVCNRF